MLSVSPSARSLSLASTSMVAVVSSSNTMPESFCAAGGSLTAFTVTLKERVTFRPPGSLTSIVTVTGPPDWFAAGVISRLMPVSALLTVTVLKSASFVVVTLTLSSLSVLSASETVRGTFFV